MQSSLGTALTFQILIGCKIPTLQALEEESAGVIRLPCGHDYKKSMLSLVAVLSRFCPCFVVHLKPNRSRRNSPQLPLCPTHPKHIRNTSAPSLSRGRPVEDRACRRVPLVALNAELPKKGRDLCSGALGRTWRVKSIPDSFELKALKAKSQYV